MRVREVIEALTDVDPEAAVFVEDDANALRLVVDVRCAQSSRPQDPRAPFAEITIAEKP